MFNFQALIKYLLEGMAVALAAFFIPQRKVEVKEIVLIALTAAAVFAILDQFTPSIGASARQGAGFGIGLNQVGWGGPHSSSGDYLYGGENTQLGPDKVTCTCEVDADTLRKRVCPIHTGDAPATPPSDSTAEDSTVADESTDEGDADAEETNENFLGDAGTVDSKNEEPFGIEAFDGFSKHF